MKKIILLLVFSSVIFSCTRNQPGIKLRNQDFSEEIIELQKYFHIPGLAVIVQNGNQTIYENYLGYADVKRTLPMNESTTIPMASLTKIFTSILIMKLVEEGKLSLNEPVSKYVTNDNIPDSIKVGHVLSHTSQGKVGKNFYYSSRFGWLTNVIENAYGKSFDVVMNEEIITPLGLKNTFLLKDSSQITDERRSVAQPYLFEGEVKDGFIDYGYSAAAGITSTVRDLAAFSQAIDKNSLIKGESKMKMFSSPKPGLPYGYGIFTQKLNGELLIWGYGQYDCYSSLFLKVPDRNLTFIVAANNNLMSDSPRLIYGDVTYSLFALSFLKNYVLNHSDIPLFEDERSLATLESRITPANSRFYLKKLLAQSIAESFMAMKDLSKTEKSIPLLEQVFKLYPDYKDYGDLTLMHNLIILKALALQKRKSNFTNFDNQIENIGTKLVTIDPENPYANFYLATYYQSRDSVDYTLKFYNRIIKAKNFDKNWYTAAAENWVKENEKNID